MQTRDINQTEDSLANAVPAVSILLPSFFLTFAKLRLSFFATTGICRGA
jgi:hypothetical protein